MPARPLGREYFDSDTQPVKRSLSSVLLELAGAKHLIGLDKRVQAMLLERYLPEKFCVPAHLREDALTGAISPEDLVKERGRSVERAPNDKSPDEGEEEQPEQQPGWVDTPQATPRTWYDFLEAEEPSEDWSWWYQERGILE